MLDALNSIVSFLGMLVGTVKDFIFYTGSFIVFIWKSAALMLEALVFIPEPFLHFCYLVVVLSILGLILKVIT